MNSRSARLAALLAGSLSALVVPPANGALDITTTNSAEALVDALISGSGFAASTPTLISGTVNGQLQQGTFTGGFSAGIGLDTGVILTTGDARSAARSNDNASATAELSGQGDPELEALLPVATSTFDANILSFMFTPSAKGTLTLRYVFASEEYNATVGVLPRFNDVFGLFVDGANKALVSISSLNCGSSVRGAAPPGTGPNCKDFVNNDFQTPAAPFDIQYDGFSVVLNVEIDVAADVGYLIKFSIADATDQRTDSAVFLAGKFEVAPVNGAPEPASIVLTGLAVLALTAARRRRGHAAAAGEVPSRGWRLS